MASHHQEDSFDDGILSRHERLEAAARLDESMRIDFRGGDDDIQRQQQQQSLRRHEEESMRIDFRGDDILRRRRQHDRSRRSSDVTNNQDDDDDDNNEDSVTSSILSQSFARSIHMARASGRAANRRSSMSRGNMSSLSSVGMSSISGAVGGGSRRFSEGTTNNNDSSSSDFFSGSRSQMSNPNSGGSGGGPGPALQSCMASSSNSRHHRRGRRRLLRVKFHRKVQCRTSLPLSSYTPDEREDTWYSSDAGKEMQKEILLTVQHMRALHGQRVPADRVDLELSAIFGELRTDRGLEHMRTSKSVENRRRHKATVAAAVLDEQTAQWDDGLETGCREGELRIAEASMVVSKVARDDAARKGRRDARFVERMTEEEGYEHSIHAAAMSASTANTASGMNASGGGLNGLDKSMDALSLGKAAIQSMESNESGGWTNFDEEGEGSSNVFSDLKRTLSSEILGSSDNPNEAEDAARSLSSSSSSGRKPAATPGLAREGASRTSMTSNALRRLRLAQIANLGSSGSESSRSPSPEEQKRRGSLTNGARRRSPSLPRRNSLRAQGA